jgi:subtilase family serine protease
MERFMRSWKLLLPLLASTLCLAQQPDRITVPIDSSKMVALTGNVHTLAQPRFDLGLTDSSQVLYGVTLAFRPSATQQANLDRLLAQQQDRSSPNYHKWLTPAQFADRFGMTRNDISRVQAWLEAQGFTVTSIANSRNQISFDGTVAQVQAAFRTEMHNYLVDSEVHLANATNPSVPAALAGLVLAMGNLHNFSPKPRAILRTKPLTGTQPHFTDTGGDHFLAPGDFATIYDLPAGLDGTNQTIAVVGQSTVSATDLANFRIAAGLAAKAPQYILYPSTSTATRCPGDEGESDLDLEWSGGVAGNANIIFVYAGLTGSDTCNSRFNSVWNALQQAVDTNVAPVISTSYGACEAANGEAFAVDMVQAWAKQANTQGQTIMASSGDAGAADCDPTNSPSATGGLAVDVPAAIPEVTGMGGNEFDGDASATVTNGNANSTTYWKGTTGGTNTLSSALSYIPEMAWNDTAENAGLLASGGGASIYFAKPTWQTGTGVPADGVRDVPDLALNASPYHDPYLICSEDGQGGTIQSTCTNGFVNASGEILLAGGTSCAAPTFSAIVALLNESLSSTGLGNINPTLYSLAASTPAAFHDVTTGNNKVPCTSGTTDCPSGTTEIGFSAGVGYDQVTGLGSVKASTLFTAWKASLAPDFALSATTLTPTPVSAGQSASATLTISPIAGSVATVVNFTPSSCSGLPAGATCSFNPASVTFTGSNSPTTTLTISTLANMALPSGAQTITITPTGSSNTTAQVSLTVTATTETFTLASTNGITFPVTVGGAATINIAVTGTNGFINTSNSTTALPITYTCTGVPPLPTAEISCVLPNNGQPSSAISVAIALQTTAPTAQLRSPLDRGSRIFYALLLPGLFGVVLVAGSRTRVVRLLSLIVILGFSTLWLGSCSSGGGGGNTTTPTNPGTPAGSYAITINATTGGAAPLTYTLTGITFNVAQ